MDICRFQDVTIGPSYEIRLPCKLAISVHVVVDRARSHIDISCMIGIIPIIVCPLEIETTILRENTSKCDLYACVVHDMRHMRG